jgi:23S rRNA (uracil1939-C5)-methyltransferase
MPTSLPAGTELTLCIDRLGAQGDGIGQHQGQPVYVPYTLPGENVRIVVEQTSRDGIRARLREVCVPSPLRREAPCPHHGSCGGCSVLHLQPDAYRQLKTERLEEAVRRAGYPASCVAAMVEIGPGSRRRAEFSVQVEKGVVHLGFLAPRAHRLVSIDTCHVLSPGVHAAMVACRAGLSALSRPSLLQRLSLTETASGIDMQLMAREPLKAVDQQALVTFAQALGVQRLSLRLAGESAPPPDVLYAAGEVEALFGGYAVALPPGAFLQASQHGEDALVRAVLAGLEGFTRIADIYSGCGTYSLPLVRAGHRVDAFEGSAEMVAALHNAARRYGLQERLEARQRDLFRSPLSAAELRRFDAAVMNPPRNGALPQAQALAASGLARIVVVSCNPATFARDAIPLREAGYQLERALPVDQFYGSSHLELVAVFSKRP